MNKNKKEIIVGWSIAIITIIFLAVGTGSIKYVGNRKPEVKVETKTEVKYLLGEKKECEDKGGKFYVITNILLLTDNKEYDYWLSCDKRYKEGNKSITETIFDYKI